MYKCCQDICCLEKWHHDSWPLLKKVKETSLYFKCRFLWPSSTDANHHDDICSGNISPGDICTYQQYFSCYWSHFDKTFWIPFFWGLNFCQQLFLEQNSFGPNIFWTKRFLGSNLFYDLNLLDPWGLWFFLTIFFTKILLTQIFCGPDFLVYSNFFGFKSLTFWATFF